MRIFVVILALGVLITLRVAADQFTGALPASPIALEGTVTLVDTNRGLLVIQNREQAWAAKLDLMPSGLRLGERVVVEGKVAPYFSTFPDYPDNPSGSGALGTFEAPAFFGDHFLARLRGFLHVPTDGDYTFWVAADDEAELFLGTTTNDTSAKKIAAVSNATRPNEWARDAEQKSQPIFLKAGERYYIEAMQREWRGQDHLAVAWQGPGFERQVINGECLSPWRAVGNTTNGILHEYWTNCFITRLTMLAPKLQDAGIVRVAGARVKLFRPGELPLARRVELDRLSEARNFSWVELEGAVSFVAADKGVLTLELMEANERNADADTRVTVHVLDWGNQLTAQLCNRKVRVRGVCERTLDAKGEAKAAILWAQDAQQVTPLDFVETDWRDLAVLPMFDLTSTNLNLAWGRKVLVHGTVMSYDEKTSAVTLRGDDSFYAYSSSDGMNWIPVGVPVPVAMGDSIFAGLAASSMTNTLGTEVMFDQASLDFSKSESVGLGGIQTNGSITFTNAIVTLRPGGGNDWDATDEGLFLYQRLEREGEIVARLGSFKSTRISDKAGLMMRESLNADAPYVALVMTHWTRLDLQYRAARQATAKSVDSVGSTIPRWLKLARRQTTLAVQLMDGEKVRPHQQVELVGLLNWKKGDPVLTEAYVRATTRTPRLEQTAPATAETHEVQIAALPSEAAESEQYLGENYLIRGVVTFKDRAFGRNLLFLQDESGAALMRVGVAFLRSQRLEPGQLLEAKGAVRFSPGAPPFGLNTGSVLGWGELPQPIPYPERAVAKLADSRWVEAKGIVRSVTNNVMIVTERDSLLPVWVGGLTSSNALAQYVDSLVTVRGVFSLQLAPGPVLLVPSPRFIEVKESAPADPFIIPSFAINKVSAPDVNVQLLHRTKISGVVTYRDERSLIVQDSTAGARVMVSALDDVNVGDRVEVVGFPELEDEAVTLHEALFRRAGEGHLPEPTAMLLEGVLEGRLNCWLVRLDGIVLDQKIRGGQQLLELQNGQRVFEAVLPASAGRMELFPVGSRVQVTGVSQLQFAGLARSATAGRVRPIVATMHVLLRAPTDLVLLERPPWWTWKHTAALVATLALVLIGSLVWIRTLRRRVEQRTHELKEAMGQLQKETEVSATLAERDRLAAEIHDTLEQGLSGIMMQLDGVDLRLNTDAEGARQNLEMARRMVRFSRAEVRHSLWNLESQWLKDGNLGAALAEIVRQMSAGNSVSAMVEIIGAPRPLPTAVEHHLVRCSQEAMSNALKHSRATAIRIKLNYGDDAVVLSIADDGCGFEPDGVLTQTGKHLGLRNLKSRTRKMKGQLAITSQPGSGTTIQLTVPLNGQFEKSITSAK